MNKSNRYEKIITLSNDAWCPNEDERLAIAVGMLIDFMQKDARDKKERVEYFKLRLKDSMKCVNSKDLHLEWINWQAKSDETK
jgi:hypothetical protein